MMTTEEKEKAITEAGYFLRDDTEMRRQWDDVIDGRTPAEAYSFCRARPFQRIHVYAGPREWAVNMAFQRLLSGFDE